jgi:hypothetical protein
VDSPDSQYEGFSETEDKLMQQYIMKDGGPIPILEMTYINKTQPRPCDKEVRQGGTEKVVFDWPCSPGKQCCGSMTFGVDPDPDPRIHTFD